MNSEMIFIRWQIILVQIFEFTEYILIEAKLIWLLGSLSYNRRKVYGFSLMYVLSKDIWYP